MSSTFDTDNNEIDRTGPDETEIDKVDEPVDGRTARAVRTREAIVDACIALLAEDDLRPSAPRIAERAGVSVRSVFQHFDDLETLYAAVGARVGEQVLRFIRYIDPKSPLDDRILDFIHQRGAVSEALTPTLRAAVVHAPGSRTINNQFQNGHDLVGALVAEVFGPELDGLGERRQVVFDALLAVSSWSTWNTMRTLNRRSEVEAERVLVHMAATILGPVVGRDLTPLVDRVGEHGAGDHAAPTDSTGIDEDPAIPSATAR